MIDHMSYAVTSVKAARAFYDAALGALGYGRVLELDLDGRSFTGYGADGKPSFWIYGGYGQGEPSPGFHVALVAPSRTAVDAFHAAALANGGSDAGKPGLRPEYHPNYYAAFVLDPDGYKVEAVCHASEPLDA